MDIKELNTQLKQLLENDIEWVYEPICNIEPVKIDELEKKEILTWEGQVDIDKAVDELHEYYKQGKLRVGFPTNTAFIYKEQTYYLALVIGRAVQQDNQLYCKYAYKHIFDKHGKETKIVDGGTLASEHSLIEAIKNVEEALDNGTPYISKKDPEKLAILFGEFLYIICFSDNPKYVTYLHNLFPPTKDYLKQDFKRGYMKTSPIKVIKHTKDDSKESS